MPAFATTTWAEIEALRGRVTAAPAASVEEAGQSFVSAFVDQYETLVLGRVFLVVPFASLPAEDQAFARRIAGAAAETRLSPTTPILSLLGTRGRDPAWNHRATSRAHRAIPLLDRDFVRGAPMIAQLLADLEVDLAGLDRGLAIATRRMLGGHNGTFYVPDAQSARDPDGRPVIADQDFVARHAVRTVFGMGGAYADGTIAVAIFFTTESLDRLAVDRFPSFISTFKMATAQLQRDKRVHRTT